LSREIGKRARRRTLLKLIDRIFDADPGIRFVALYQDQYMLAGGMKEGRSSIDPEEEARDVDLQLAKIGEVIHSWQRWFGTLGAFAIKFDKLNLVFIPLKEGRFIVLSTEAHLNPFTVLEKLRWDMDYDQIADAIP